MNNNIDKDTAFMKKALKYAQKAYDLAEVPIGAVIVKDDVIISRGYNMKERKNIATKHAEIIAIEKACGKLKNWRITGATLYVNVEPCIMCVGAILQARIKRVVYGLADKKFGACESLYRIHEDSRLNHNFEVTRGVLEEESLKLMQDFFKQLRNNK